MLLNNIKAHIFTQEAPVASVWLHLLTSCVLRWCCLQMAGFPRGLGSASALALRRHGHAQRCLSSSSWVFSTSCFTANGYDADASSFTHCSSNLIKRQLWRLYGSQLIFVLQYQKGRTVSRDLSLTVLRGLWK